MTFTRETIHWTKKIIFQHLKEENKKVKENRKKKLTKVGLKKKNTLEK